MIFKWSNNYFFLFASFHFQYNKYQQDTSHISKIFLTDYKESSGQGEVYSCCSRPSLKRVLALIFTAFISVSGQKISSYFHLIIVPSVSYFLRTRYFTLYYVTEADTSLFTSCKIFGLLSSPFLGPSELEMNIGGPQYSQQQAPPNQTAPWPESILPIDQASFASQSRWVLSPQEIQESCFLSSVRYFIRAYARSQSFPFVLDHFSCIQTVSSTGM